MMNLMFLGCILLLIGGVGTVTSIDCFKPDLWEKASLVFLVIAGIGCFLALIGTILLPFDL